MTDSELFQTLVKIPPETIKNYLVDSIDIGFEGFTPEEVKVIHRMLEDLFLYARLAPTGS